MIPLAQRLSTELRLLLESLNESNHDSILSELSQYVDYGTEGNVLLLKSCFDHFNVFEKDLTSTHLEHVVAPLFKKLLEKPQFSTVFSMSVRPTVVTEEFLVNLSGALHLTAHEKLGFGLALTDSENNDIRMAGRNFCMKQIEELCATHATLHTTDYVQDVLLFLNKSEVLSKHVDSFMQLLSLVEFDKDSMFILAPVLSDEFHESNLLRRMDFLNEENENNEFDAILAEMEKEMNMADMLKELGYNCTSDVSICKDLLSSFSPLTEVTVARILGTVIRSDAGFQDLENAFSTFCSATGRGTLSDMPSLNSWNTDVLIESIKQLAPGIRWTSVIENLDHDGFYVPDEAAFSQLISCYRHATQDPFPLAAVCGNVWRNIEGQLSFLKYAVSVPPEVFTFAHCKRQLANVDAVNSHKYQSGHANHAWLCVDFLEVLCQLAERGLAKSVRSLLEYPLKHCPEVLLFGMAHVNTPYNLLQHEVALAVVPVILKDASVGGVLLHLWHVNPPFLVRALNDAINMDSDDIIRVLDLCQELKIISPVLDMVPMPLGIRLASVASRKELLDLEKWLNSNLTTYRDTFFEECLRFLKEVDFGVQESANRLHNPGNIWSLYMETAPVILKVLQAHTNLLTSNQLSMEMERLQLTVTNNSSRMRNNGGPDPSTPEVYADDVESEVNSYFQQMFSTQMTVEAVIQMLARFKESSDRREQSIFECMIANLFEEYKFLNRYPDRQLKIAAVLFGMLIKNQLVTHLTLGIALRAVLDALRKPADSKMFVFGTNALEKFSDRLSEWPQYCQHILQISHLRGTHPDLVTFIERTLARNSSGHPESDAGYNPTADQHHNPTLQPNNEVTGTAFSLIGSGSSHLGSQISSPIQLQQRNQSYFDERQRASATSSNFLKPNLTTTGQASVALANEPVNIPKVTAASANDPVNIPKPQSVASSSAALASTPAFTRPSRAVTSARFGSALNIETLVAAAELRKTPIEAPPPETQDKISFIINNLSAANIETKAKEFTEILKEQYYAWFAQYMVMKRASIEPNFHDLYLKFLEKANSKSLNSEVVKATYENCRVLLGSELIKSSSEERSLLKNLGGWLGKITIGRNHCLRARDIDPKALIIEAYEKGLMIAVIPFSSKILESCSNSLAYQPPNPWTMAVLGLLAEIYAMPNLKMNLKFEIEVLFKNLSVDLKEVTPTSLLIDKVREVEGNPDFSNKDVGLAQQPMVGEVKSNNNMISALNQVELPVEVGSSSHSGGHSRILSQYAAPHHIPAATLSDNEKMAALGLSDRLPSAQGLLQAQLPFPVGQLPSSSMDQDVIINPKLQTLGLHMHFKSVLGISMELAIKEIVSSIVQRSVSIATQTTKELVLKDYAMESDESRIRSAAHLMVASLAGSLAHVTCKEPLRGSITSQLRNNLQARVNIPSDLLEHAIQLVTNDNLDLGCAFIEQAATDKAVQTIDSELSSQLSVRRKQREGVGPAFYDASMYTQSYVNVLPEALRPKPGRLSHSQQRVYEDFVRLPWQNQSNQNLNSVPLGPSPSPSPGTGSLHRGYGSSSGSVSVSGPLNPSIFTSGINAEDMEPNSAKLFSGSSVHSMVGGGMGPHNIEAVLSSFSSMSAPELHIPESSNVSKPEPGVYAQPLPSPSPSDRVISTTAEPSLTTKDAVDKYQLISEELESLIAKDAKEAEIQSVIGEVPGVILRCISRDEAALAVAQKVFQGLYENSANTAHVNAHLAMLTAIRDVSKLVFNQLTSWVIYSDEDRKFNKDITIGLISRDLLNLAEYNIHMAKFLDAGKNKVATEFAISLIQTLVAGDTKVISELQNIVDVLAKLAQRPDAPEALQQLVEIARNPAGKDDIIRQEKDKKVSSSHLIASKDDTSVLESSELDPAAFQEQVSMLFAEWYRIYELPGVNDQMSSRFVLQLQQNGLLKADDTSDRFFRRLLDIAVSHCISSEGAVQSHQQTQTLSFLAIDMFASLVLSILKFSTDHGLSKLSLFSKVLAVTVRFIQVDAEEKKTSFNPRPYFRLFIDWLLDLSTLEPVFEGANFQILTVLATSFHALQPLKVPAFSFVWLELVSHRSFMPKLLTGNAQKGWPYFQRLLVDLFQFMEPFLRNAELAEPVRFLYRGTLRVLLVLLHDFPEFLCDYHFSFCDIIPPSCIQMRNIVLSAFPRNMRLPDPSTPNLKIDLLAEISQSPRILSEVDAALKAKQMKSDVDEYLKTRQGTFLSELKQKLLLSPSEAARAGTRYNVPLMNSLVLHVGIQAIQQQQQRTPHGQSMASNASLAIFLVGEALDIFQTLIFELETEGRYLFLNAIANQLRYPNNHTHYFSFILLYLFSESNQEAIQEQITRVLLERLIVNRPHPWGLLITFIELIKNPRYNFWSRSFTRCAPEIEKLFESVSRSCGGPKPMDDSVVAGGISDAMH